jgi:site-specific DNA-methyltransferase (adenine-specific)
LFPDTKSGAIKPYVRNKKNVNVDFLQGTDEVEKSFDANSGSAARFFYCAKASKRDRNEGLDGFEVKRSSGYGYDHGLGNAGEGMFKDRNPIKANHHPTVKPTSLMQYLVRLVTPPSGIVLDPFMGSGSTGKACAYEGFDFIGIEQSAEYVEIAKARIDFVHAHLEQVLFPPGFDR